MNGRWRWVLAAVVALCCAGLPALTLSSAAARARPVAAHVAGCGGSSSSTGSFGTSGRILSQLDVPLCATGLLTVTFAGDPAAGCAAEGLCDYSGTETFDPDGDGDLSLVTTAHRGRRSTSGSLFLGGNSSPVTSAVQRTVSSGTTSETTACSDDVGGGEGFGEFFTLNATGGRMTIDLAHAQQSLVGSRCAGPIGVDIASAMPSRTVELRTMERGETAIDLTGGGTFAAHGLSGTVTSTIVLRLGRPRRERETPVDAPPGHATHARLERSATADYRIARLTGTAVATVQGSATPAVCGPFDACGLSGTIAVLPGTSARGSASLFALDRGATRGELLAQLRGAGPPSTKLIGGGVALIRGQVQADLTQGGTCSDSVALDQFSIQLARLGRRFRVSLAPSDSQAADPLRTRCPGPDLGSHMLAGETVPASVLRRPSFTVALRGLAFSDGPYRVTTRSSLTLTLRRTATRVRTIRVVTVQRGSSAVSRAG
jgi:hypothetical protein